MFWVQIFFVICDIRNAWTRLDLVPIQIHCIPACVSVSVNARLPISTQSTSLIARNKESISHFHGKKINIKFLLHASDRDRRRALRRRWMRDQNCIRARVQSAAFIQYTFSFIACDIVVVMFSHRTGCNSLAIVFIGVDVGYRCFFFTSASACSSVMWKAIIYEYRKLPTNQS